MKTDRAWLKKIMVICVILLPSLPVLADDTDIFLGNGVYQAGTLPNVLFILDNSGSMNNDARDSNGNSTGQTRLEAMKDAFSEIMSNVSGVNVGLMRFNAPGGSVMYPVTNVDQVLSTTSLQTNPDMFASTDDAIEQQSNGQVTLDSDSLRLGFAPDLSGVTSITSFIQHEDDDREEYKPTGQEWDGSWMNFRSTQINALRYYGMNIPQGATIVDAHLEFVSPYGSYGGDATVQIRAQAADNPPTFSGANYDITNRWNTQSTTAYVDWSISSSDSWPYGSHHDSPNIASVLQEIVNRSDWDPNDAVVLMFDHIGGSGERAGTLRRESSSSTQGLSGTATLLHVTYSVSASPSENLVGLRFQQIGIPQGATIDSAYIHFTSAEAVNTTDSLQLKVRVESSDDAADFTNSAYSLSARSKYTSEVMWEPEADWPLDNSMVGPDVTNLVQQVVNRTGWCGNNSMAFYIEPTVTSPQGYRVAHALDESLARHAELVVTYSSGSSGCINEIWSQRVDSSEDDAEESSSGSVTNSSSDLDIESSQEMGIRIENVPISQGATILEAYLELTSYDDDGGSMFFDIYGHDIDNSNAFINSSSNISNRTKTTSNVRWTPVDWVDNAVYRSPDITDVIQEIVDRSGWSAGNALSLILESSSSSTDRDAYTYDGSTSKAPKLVVKIQSGGVSTSSFTVRQHLNNLVQNLEGRTWTPIVDTMYEAALYLRGDPMHYGLTRELFTPNDGDTDKRYKRVSVVGSYTGGTHVMPSGCEASNLDDTDCRDEVISSSPTAPVYTSPIVSDCQSTHLVLLTDGEANNNHSVNLIKTMTGNSNCDNDSSDSDEDCGRSLANWMANNDMRPSLSATDNTVVTHTIAFNLSNNGAVDFLQDMASEGQGSFYNANTASELADAFDNIISSIISIDSSFSTAGATVNQFDRLTHRNDVYFSVFKPLRSPSWLGNLKHYKLLGNPPVIVDANDQEAVDESSGFFKATAKSIWSSVVDGPDVALGGAAQKLPDNVDLRKTYTYLSGAASPSLVLSNATNAFNESNTEITVSMVNANDSTERNQIIKWARGYDVLDADGDGDYNEARKQMGDPLHSTPLLVTYGGTAENPDVTLFYGTNEGFLHAVAADTGIEKFAFMPEALLPNLKTLYDNSSSFDHPYGLDGSPVAWIQDTNYNNEIEPSQDSVYLYMGMRRGGRNYYALDVTDRNAPKILWTIEGGSGDFTTLGQTWSKPVKTQVKIGASVKDVLIFAGGFDPNIDNSPNTRVNASMGNAIYIVDANTGDRLWMAGNGVIASDGLHSPDMLYAIASDVGVVDMNLDGLADQMYVGDTGGQVWRFDINNGSSVANLVDGGVIAELGDSSGADYRRFFFSPDISLFSEGGDARLAIAIGSGAINEPLDQTAENRFYVLFQEDVFSAPASYTRLTETNLTDRTNASDDVTLSSDGWYVRLSTSGEKSLATSLTVDNKIIFTTYEPSAAVSACSGITGVGRVYLVSLTNGNAVEDLDGSGTLDTNDRYRVLTSPSIPPSPKMLFLKEESYNGPAVLIGPEQPLQDIDLSISMDWEKVYWYQD